VHQTDELYRTLVTFSPDALYVHIDGRITFVNPGCCRLLGAEDPSQLIGKSVLEIVHPEYHDRVRERWNLISGGEHAPPLEEKFVRLDGTVVDVEVSAVPIDWEGSRGVQVIARDITERKRAQESQLLLTTALESAANGVVITDLKGNMVWVNEAFTGMTGYTRGEAVGRNPRLLNSREQDSSFYRVLWDTILAGNVWRGDLVNRKKDGSLYTEEMTITPVKNADGEITHFIAVKQDTTERKRAERELRLMAQTVACARDCISITDLDNKFLFVNDAFQELYGYAMEELTGKDISLLRAAEAPPAGSENILRETLAGGWHGEILNRRKDGSDLPVELWTSTVRDEAGTPVATVGVARDISERKASEAHLKKSEEQFRLIAENVADMIAVVDLEGRRIYNSPSYESLFGNTELLKGTDGFQEIHPDDVAKVKQVFQDTVRTGIGQRLEYRFQLKDGSVRNIESKGSVIRDADGKISQVIVVSRDVTEEKRLAAQFLRAQRMESIGTLAGGIAHDLNNVLAPIMMAIEVLRTKIPDPGGQKILGTIETAARRGADIVRQVLAFGRGVKSDRILVQLKHLMQEIAKIAGETFPKSIEITSNIPRNLWTVSADPTQMHQVLLNLMVNARDAMPKGGTLTIAAENIELDEMQSRMQPEAKPGAYVSMAVTDTGTGIPAAIREKIFEPFFTTKEIGHGTGLGLSTTLAIVRSHEGFITLDTDPGKGTTFRVYIPAIGTDSGGAVADEIADLPVGHGELILIIDDEASIREITTETLEAYGYKAITASDGAEGISVFAENKNMIRAVIIDIMMPVMDGTAAIPVLKTIDPGVTIIAASGLTTRGTIPTPLDSNVKAVMIKPYTAEKLLKTIQSVL
jgi:PAS domain S-box-containing protein